MKILNLSEGFNPFTASKTDQILFDKHFFNGGEPHIKLHVEYCKFSTVEYEDVMVTARLRDMNDIGMLMVAVDALRNTLFYRNIHLFVPKFPGAQQDRIMQHGEPFTVKVFANLINSMNFFTVTILDPHSDVTPALIDRCVVMTNHNFVLSALQKIYTKNNQEFPFLISPDAGAEKKVYSLAKFLNIYNRLHVVTASKKRDTTTGRITNTVVHIDDLDGIDCVIVDDICDGGRTFIKLARALKVYKNAGNLHLIVTHGIFSNGFKELAKYFETIHTTDSIVSHYSMEIPEIEKKSEICTVIPIKL